MASNLPKASILFKSLRQTVSNRAKSSFVYDLDKTTSQKWVNSRINKLKEQQKLYAVGYSFSNKNKKIIKLFFFKNKKRDDGVPIWLKTNTDKALTAFVAVGTLGSFVVTLVNLSRYALGKL